MQVRELSSVDVERQREKGIDAAKNLVSGLTGEMTIEDKLDKLSDRFARCADCSDRMLDNFDPYKFFRRKNHRKAPEELKIILLGAFKASSEMEELVRSMDELGRGKMNGHTRLFMQQRELCDLMRCRLFIAQELYLTNRFDRVRSPVFVKTRAAIGGFVSAAARVVSQAWHHPSHS